MALGPPDASTSALSAALDETILTDIELSTAAPDGPSNPFSSAQGGWIVGSQEVDPYTNVASANGTLNPFVGRDVDPYTNVAADGANPNALTGGQDVNAFTGYGAVPDTVGPSKDPTNLAEAFEKPYASSSPASGQSAFPAPMQSSPVEPDMGVHDLTPDERAELVARYAQYDVELAASQGRGGSTTPAAGTEGSTADAPGAPPTLEPTVPPVAPTFGATVPAAPDWTAQTAWAYPRPDPRLIQPVTSYDTGNRPMNFLLNKVLLPWRNALAFVENVPLATIIGIDDALKHSPVQMEYQAAQDMMPLEGAMGLATEVGPALDYAVTWMSTNQRLRSLATAPAYWFMGAGGAGGGIMFGPQRAPAVLDVAAAAKSGVINPRPGEELFVGEWLNLDLQRKLDTSAASFVRDPHTMAQLVPPNIPYRAVPPYGGFVVEYGTKSAIADEWILDNIVVGVPQSSQMVKGGAPDLVLRPPFAHWNLRPWDITTAGQAELKAARGVDYNFLIYQVDWDALKLW